MGKIAFVFAGQGAQYTGMGKELYESSPGAKRILDLAESLRPGTIEQCFFGSKELLSQTINTQPCLFLVDYISALALNECGIQPDMLAGFSLGEIAAVAYTGMLSFEDAFKFIMFRAELMAECAEEHQGGMLAVLRLSGEEVTEICNSIDSVYPVNFNSPGQTVVSGSEAALSLFTEAAEKRRGRVIRLAVSGGFHSPFMDGAAVAIKKYFDEGINLTRQPSPCKIYGNVTAEPYGVEDMAAMLTAQVNSPVLWQRSIENMIADGCTTFVEVGAGKTLCGLIKKINPEVTVCNVEDISSLNRTAELIRGGSPC